MKTIKIATFATLFVLASLTGFAQKSYTLTSEVPGKTAAQALSDTSSGSTPRSQIIAVSKTYPAAVIYTKVEKISGTPGGYVRLFVSDNGTDFVRFGGADSALIYNVAGIQMKRFPIPGTPDRYYRLQYIGVGTMSAKFATKLLVKP